MRLGAVVASVALSVAGCGGAAATPADASVLPAEDAASEAATGCQPQFGRSYVVDHFEVMAPGEGLDLTGDGVPDNALGALGAVLNPSLDQAIAAGFKVYLWDVTGWSEPPTPDDPDIGLAFYNAQDADVPVDPTNNYGGEGRFVASAEQFDLACSPTSEFQHATLEGGVLRAATDRWDVYNPDVGTLEYRDVQGEFVFNADYSGFAFVGGAVATICAASRTPFPGPTTGAVLDALVNTLGLAPDIDRDGDGLERLVGDGMSVVQCIDGNGTIIDGHGCVCDPRIADGYSVAMRGTGVRATIVGVVQP